MITGRQYQERPTFQFGAGGILDKQDDAGIALAHDLQYTPTFIVKDDGKELVRVIEKPTGTLAQDLTQGL